MTGRREPLPLGCLLLAGVGAFTIGLLLILGVLATRMVPDLLR